MGGRTHQDTLFRRVLSEFPSPSTDLHHSVREKPKEHALQTFEVEGPDCRVGNHDDVEIHGHRRAVTPEDLPETSLHAVAHDGIPNFSTDREAQSRSSELVATHDQPQPVPGGAFTVLEIEFL